MDFWKEQLMIYQIQKLMSENGLVNPFASNRSTVIASSSLLSYGDDSYSVYKLLKGNARLYRSQVTITNKDMEERILWKYEKQYYEMDQSGRSLAEEAIDERLQREKDAKDDFWTKLQRPQTSRNSNPFIQKSLKDELETASNFTASTFTKKTAGLTTVIAGMGERKAHCLEAMKLKHKIQSKRESENVVNKDEKFSLSRMYTKKQAIDGYGAGTTVTFGRLQSNSSLKREQTKFEYPQTIFVRQDQYFFIPLT